MANAEETTELSAPEVKGVHSMATVGNEDDLVAAAPSSTSPPTRTANEKTTTRWAIEVALILISVVVGSFKPC